jgi:hypothetical protein
LRVLEGEAAFVELLAKDLPEPERSAFRAAMQEPD